MTFFTPGFTHALDRKRSKNKLWANFFWKLERKKEHVGEVNTFYDSSLKCFWAWCAKSLISKINILGKNGEDKNAYSFPTFTGYVW